MSEQQRPPLLKREVSIGDLISLLVALAAVFAAYGRLDTRLIVVETTQAYQSKADDTYKADTKATLRDINDKLNNISDRLPRK